jgi:hypothetical protein
VPQDLVAGAGPEWSKKYDNLIRNAPKAG